MNVSVKDFIDNNIRARRKNQFASVRGQPLASTVGELPKLSHSGVNRLCNSLSGSWIFLADASDNSGKVVGRNGSP